jgi:hypothetical protein
MTTRKDPKWDPNWRWDGRPPEELTPFERWHAEAEPEYQRKCMSPEERSARAVQLLSLRAGIKASKERRAAPIGPPTWSLPPYPQHVKELAERAKGRSPYVKPGRLAWYNYRPWERPDEE